MILPLYDTGERREKERKRRERERKRERERYDKINH
jgi:hypothetical protein